MLIWQGLVRAPVLPNQLLLLLCSKSTLKSGAKVLLEGSLADLRGSGQPVCFQATLVVCGVPPRGLRRLAASLAPAHGSAINATSSSRSLLVPAPAPATPPTHPQSPLATSADEARLASLVAMRANLRVASSDCSSQAENQAKDLLDLAGRLCSAYAATVGQYFQMFGIAKGYVEGGSGACLASESIVSTLGHLLDICEAAGGECLDEQESLYAEIARKGIDSLCKASLAEVNPVAWINVGCDVASILSSVYSAAATACGGDGACLFSECALVGAKCMPAGFPIGDFPIPTGGSAAV